MEEKFQRGFEDAEENGFYRAAVDYLLYTVRCYFLMYVEDPSDKGYIVRMEDHLQIQKNGWKNILFWTISIELITGIFIVFYFS